MGILTEIASKAPTEQLIGARQLARSAVRFQIIDVEHTRYSGETWWLFHIVTRGEKELYLRFRLEPNRQRNEQVNALRKAGLPYLNLCWIEYSTMGGGYLALMDE